MGRLKFQTGECEWSSGESGECKELTATRILHLFRFTTFFMHDLGLFISE
jgi:hypothetical protein